jgi:hypothetical protein
MVAFCGCDHPCPCFRPLITAGDLGVGAAVLVAARIDSESKPPSEAHKTQPSEGAGATPSPPAIAANELKGTAHQQGALEGVRAEGWWVRLSLGMEDGNGFTRQSAMASDTEPELRGVRLAPTPRLFRLVC